MLRRSIATIVPEVADRVSELHDWDQVKLLTVQANRLAHWHRPGYLAIGDAAHAMSPIAGVGINLAVQDAVVAANVLWAPLRRGRVTEEDSSRYSAAASCRYASSRPRSRSSRSVLSHLCWRRPGSRRSRGSSAYSRRYPWGATFPHVWSASVSDVRVLSARSGRLRRHRRSSIGARTVLDHDVETEPVATLAQESTS